jgi:hypothetical protein
MKKNHLWLLLLLTIGFSLGACKKDLNVFPTTSEVDGNLITDQESAQAVLNGVYYQFAAAGDFYNDAPGTFWVRINESVPSEYAGSLVYAYQGLSFYDAINGAGDGRSDTTWNYGYTLVNAANGFIRNLSPIANIPAAAKRQMLAEAKFLRAFGNSDLLLYFGQYNDPSSKYGIILRDTFVTAANINLPRSGVAAAYTAILSDLDSAILGLPALNTSICYANASDAKLLKARVLINRGAAGDYAEVIGLTNDIITNGPFSLEDSLKDIFLTKGLSSKEVMLGIQPYPNETIKFDTYVGINIRYLATDSLVSLLANDARNQWVYQYAYNPDLYASGNILTKYYSGDPGNPVQTPLSTYCYAFRLSEAYLLEAEAITLSTGDLASAKTLLTTVMSHAGAGPQEMAAVANASTPAALQVEIVKENLRNFVYENGVDWFALRRLPLATLQQLNPNIQHPYQLIFPIPTAELMYNNVIQNPGY